MLWFLVWGWVIIEAGALVRCVVAVMVGDVVGMALCGGWEVSLA